MKFLLSERKDLSVLPCPSGKTREMREETTYARCIAVTFVSPTLCNSDKKMKASFVT